MTHFLSGRSRTQARFDDDDDAELSKATKTKDLLSPFAIDTSRHWCVHIGESVSESSITVPC